MSAPLTRPASPNSEPKYLGNFAACEPWAAVGMTCFECNVSWMGCWDNFQCPQCGEGELPSVGDLTRIVLCEACGSEGRVLVADGYDRDGAPQERDEGPCPYCDGTGGEIIEVEPITLEDIS